MRGVEPIVLTLIVASSILRSVSAQEPLAAAGPFRESVAIHVDSRTVRSIETAREHLSQRQWSEAIPILQQIVESRESSLIPVEPGRYLNTADYCHLLISQLPSEGLAAYRAQIDPRFRERFETAQKTLDEAELSMIVRSAFNSSFADETLLLLADLKFERGEYAAAREHLELLVPANGPPPADSVDVEQENRTKPLHESHLTFQDSSLPLEEILARLTLCSIFEGDQQRAANELRAFFSWYADAEGDLAGRHGLLIETLQAELQKSFSWPSYGSGAQASFAGQPSRNPIPARAVRPNRVLWQQPLPRSSLRLPDVRPLLASEQPLSLHPIVVDENLFVANAEAVFAFELETGQPAWAGEDADARSADDAVIFPGRSMRNVLHRQGTGVPSFTLSTASGRLFARRGSPLLRKSPFETQAVSEIVALDIAQREGQLDLRITSNEIEPKAGASQTEVRQFEKSPEATPWSFEGTPVVEDRRLFVSLRQGAPEDRTVVACFDNRTGALVWKSDVTANLSSLPDHINLVGTNLLTLDNGRLFLATGTGAIAALDADTGRVLWVVTYESRPPENLEAFSDPRRIGLTPCLSAEGIVFAAPPDSELLYALEATTGRLVWARRLSRQPQHLIAVRSGRLFVSGDSLQALDALTGAPAWPQPVSFANLAGQSFGRPALTLTEIIWPLHDELLYVDQASGRINHRINLRQMFGIPAGNLLLHDGRLIVAQSKSVTVLDVAEFAPNAK